MKKLILGALFIASSLFADLRIPKVLSGNNFEAYEFQLFVTNTRNVAITDRMTSKVVFEGDAEDYLKNFKETSDKRFKAGEDIAKTLVSANQQIGNAAYFKDIKSLQGIGVTAIGVAIMNPILGALLGDDTYVQVQDFYDNDKKVTRVIKYLVSDDSLDEDDYQLVFKTTNTDSYHFRSGAIKNFTQRFF